MRKTEEGKITELLSKFLQPKEPSAEFEMRLSIKLKTEFQKIQVERSPDFIGINCIPRIGEEKTVKRIDMERIQRIIGMAVTNENFRRNLFEDVERACRDIGFDLSEVELAALKNLKADAVMEFAGELDERISKRFAFPSS